MTDRLSDAGMGMPPPGMMPPMGMLPPRPPMGILPPGAGLPPPPYGMAPPQHQQQQPPQQQPPQQQPQQQQQQQQQPPQQKPQQQQPQAGSSAPSGPGPAKSAWTEHTAPDGRKYFYNQQTKQSSWEKPAELLTSQVGTQLSWQWAHNFRGSGSAQGLSEVRVTPAPGIALTASRNLCHARCKPSPPVSLFLHVAFLAFLVPHCPSHAGEGRGNPLEGVHSA